MAGDGAIPGFYAAWGRWLDVEYGPDALYKVGHTGDLRARLLDDAYVTAFPESHWRYAFTFETSTKEEAFRLETGVLFCARARRLGARELVRMSRAEIGALAARVAAALGVAGAPRAAPEYRRPPPRAATGGGAPPRAPRSPRLSDEARRALDAHTVPAVPAAGADDDGLDSFVEGLVESFAAGSGPGPLPATAGGGEPAPAQKKTLAECVRGARADPAGPDVEDSADDADPMLLLEDALACGPDPLLGRGAGRPPGQRLEERPYQTEAIAACLRELKASGRTVLQMACRCGKTRVAHGVIESYLRLAGREGAARILYLVPSLALLRQTAWKLDGYGLDARVLLVGSDDRPLPRLETLRPVDPAAPGRREADGVPAQTTDPAAIARVCGGADAGADSDTDDGNAPLLVVSTYQSSPLLPDRFDLIVFDESHRVCGERKLRAFTKVLLDFTRGDRLYMTATPHYDAPLGMKDRALFGGEAYAYPLRRGIDAGYVNDFELRLVGGGDDSAGGMAARIAAVMEDETVAKLLVFCRSIRHAAELRQEVARLEETAAGRGGRAFACLSAHSQMGPAEIGASLAEFCAPGARAVLFNCRLFQEGVEIPALNGVFFAAPRHSPRDIIQTLCRPLNKAEGKPLSKIFLPVSYDAGAAPGDPANLGRFASVVPFFDALVAEDPTLYQHLLDPVGTPYPLRWVESAARGCPVRPRYRPEELLAAVRRTIRYGGAGHTERLLRAARIPWEIGFGELQRIVRLCGRYPKTTDTYRLSCGAKVNFNQFYHYVRDSYSKWLAGGNQPLEPFQLQALRELPGWDPYGIQGPYPWGETLAYLEEWLAEHDGTLPPVNVNNGGYVGLEATPMERLSGTLTCVNQGDGRDRKTAGKPKPGSGFTLDSAKQIDLDRICARWGLCWRKERHPPPEDAPEGSVGSLLENAKGEYVGRPTFIQEAYSLFKRFRREQGDQSEEIQKLYPGFPSKHLHQERPDVWARRKELLTPRWRGRRRDGRPGPAASDPAVSPG